MERNKSAAGHFKMDARSFEISSHDAELGERRGEGSLSRHIRRSAGIKLFVIIFWPYFDLSPDEAVLRPNQVNANGADQN